MDLYTTAFSFPRAPHHPNATGAQQRKQRESATGLRAHHRPPYRGVGQRSCGGQPGRERSQECARVLHHLEQGRPRQGLDLLPQRELPECHGGAWLHSARVPRAGMHAGRPRMQAQNGSQTRVAIRVTRSEVMDGSEPKAEFRRRLDEISHQTYTRIVVTKAATQNTLPFLGSGGWAGLETERMAELVVTGPLDCVEIARARLLVLLDEMVRCRDHWPNTTSLSFRSRTDFTLSPSKLTRSCTRSLPPASAASSRAFNRKLRPIFISPTLFTVFWVPSSGRWQRHQPRARLRNRTRASFGSRASSTAFNALAICCIKFPCTRYVRFLSICVPRLTMA